MINILIIVVQVFPLTQLSEQLSERIFNTNVKMYSLSSEIIAVMK